MKPTSSWKVFKHMKFFKLFCFWENSTNCRDFCGSENFQKTETSRCLQFQKLEETKTGGYEQKPTILYTKHWLQPCCAVIVNLDLWFQFYKSGTMICLPHLSRRFSMAATLNKGQPSGWLKEAHGHESIPILSLVL
jgi:hypothetical protein